MPGLLIAAAFTFAALAFLAALGTAAAFTFAALAFRAALGTAAFTFATLAFLGVFFGAAAFTFAAFAFLHVGVRNLHVATVQLGHGKRIAVVRRRVSDAAGCQTGGESGTDSKGKWGFGFVSHWIISCCGQKLAWTGPVSRRVIIYTSWFFV
jgi:hypothetical protein